MTEPSHFVVVTQPRASSGLGGYLIEALLQQGAAVDVVDALASKPHKLWPVLQSVRLDREAMWKARWENMLFSSWAWRRNARLLAWGWRRSESAGVADAIACLSGEEFFYGQRYRPYSQS